MPYPVYSEEKYTQAKAGYVSDTIQTRNGNISFPAFIPVSTFGGKFFLDEILHAYLPRFWGAVMVSVYYAKNIDAPYILPTFIDSGGLSDDCSYVVYRRT
ncbi:MAG: hypothetical protein NUW37_07065 [Planctomycetes bacterium]|nr:hypothetical protein [Planctomycetota bacterium]